ncbi:MAG: hypothetical protein ACUVUE_05330 [Candidatus Bathycorpusculaceae bacterium]
MVQEKQGFTCPNPKCRRTFDNPKLVQYYACPYCLTEIKETAESGCKHYLGYLSERSQGEEIPEYCITCEKTLECMLSKLKSDSATKEIRKWYKIQ